MIKIVNGFGGPGGSTVAFNNLVNLFNSKGLSATFYTPTKWEGITCKWDNVNNCKYKFDDVCIYHFSLVKVRPKVRKVILSCHETNVFPIKEQKGLIYDEVHFVSKFQQEWQGVEGHIIPNVVKKYSFNRNKQKKIAGVIGSVDTNKRTHLSIERALEDGHQEVHVYGSVTDQNYFRSYVIPLLGDKVSYKGIANDMQPIYDLVTDVYHSPKQETFNLIKAECKFAQVNYHGDEGNDTQAEYWDNERILDAWKKLLSY